MKYCCYKCAKKGTYTEVPKDHFTSEDGRILCEECSQGVKPCSKDIKKKLGKE